LVIFPPGIAALQKNAVMGCIPLRAAKMPDYLSNGGVDADLLISKED
jgi:hypothetical protein